LYKGTWAVVGIFLKVILGPSNSSFIWILLDGL
jgi:hypothetical protein